MTAKKALKTRLTGAGNIVTGVAGLSSLTVDNPTGGALTVEFNDATSGTGSDVFQVTIPSNDFRHLSFVPPMPFATGIRAGTLGAGLIVIGCYVL